MCVYLVRRFTFKILGQITFILIQCFILYLGVLLFIIISIHNHHYHFHYYYYYHCYHY